MRTAIIALGLFLALSSTSSHRANAQCCRPFYGPQIGYQPIVQMAPTTVMQPQVTGYQPVMAIPQRIQYRTPLRDFLFGRFRYQYIPVQMAPMRGNASPYDSDHVHDHIHKDGRVFED